MLKGLLWARVNGAIRSICRRANFQLNTFWIFIFPPINLTLLRFQSLSTSSHLSNLARVQKFSLSYSTSWSSPRKRNYILPRLFGHWEVINQCSACNNDRLDNPDDVPPTQLIREMKSEVYFKSMIWKSLIEIYTL